MVALAVLSEFLNSLESPGRSPGQDLVYRQEGTDLEPRSTAEVCVARSLPGTALVWFPFQPRCCLTPRGRWAVAEVSGAASQDPSVTSHRSPQFTSVRRPQSNQPASSSPLQMKEGGTEGAVGALGVGVRRPAGPGSSGCLWRRSHPGVTATEVSGALDLLRLSPDPGPSWNNLDLSPYGFLCCSWGLRQAQPRWRKAYPSTPGEKTPRSLRPGAEGRPRGIRTKPLASAMSPSPLHPSRWGLQREWRRV